MIVVDVEGAVPFERTTTDLAAVSDPFQVGCEGCGRVAVPSDVAPIPVSLVLLRSTGTVFGCLFGLDLLELRGVLNVLLIPLPPGRVGAVLALTAETVSAILVGREG